eukprot:scaffold15763_cov50-Phaeocystis_antarctica.AAC.2
MCVGLSQRFDRFPAPALALCGGRALCRPSQQHRRHRWTHRLLRQPGSQPVSQSVTHSLLHC